MVIRMNNITSVFIFVGVAEDLIPLQFPFLFREKGALIDRQSLSFISLPQVATGLRYACRARSVGGTFSQTKLCTWMAATCAVALHSYAESGLADGSAPDTAFVKFKIAYAILLYGEVHDGNISSLH